MVLHMIYHAAQLFHVLLHRMRGCLGLDWIHGLNDCPSSCGALPPYLRCVVVVVLTGT